MRLLVWQSGRKTALFWTKEKNITHITVNRLGVYNMYMPHIHPHTYIRTPTHIRTHSHTPAHCACLLMKCLPYATLDTFAYQCKAQLKRRSNSSRRLRRRGRVSRGQKTQPRQGKGQRRQPTTTMSLYTALKDKPKNCLELPLAPSPSPSLSLSPSLAMPADSSQGSRLATWLARNRVQPAYKYI